MIGAAFRVMALSLPRDRAALVIAFVPPTPIFAIFSGAIGDRIHLGVADRVDTAANQRLADALPAEPSLRVTRLPANDPTGVIRPSRSGAVDVALVLRGDLIATPTDDAPAPADQPVVLVENPAKALATPIALGRAPR